jgi:hypothetical protein
MYKCVGDPRFTPVPVKEMLSKTGRRSVRLSSDG